ncbi:MAG: hypothetical protein ABH983_02510, partial [Candidatus Micrarchaeota archaeon]
PLEEIERNKWNQKAVNWLKDKFLPTMKMAAVTVTVPVLIAASSAGCGARTGLLDDYNAPDAIVDAGADSDVFDGDVETDGEVDGDIESDGDADEDVIEPPTGPLIGDHINRRLGDREDNIAGDSDSAYTIGGSEESENANPFTDGNGGDIGVSEEFMYHMSSTDTELLMDNIVIDDHTADTFQQEHNVWVRGDTHFSTDTDSIVADVRFIAYSTKFHATTDHDLGIPVCGSSTETYPECLDSWEDVTAAHRVAISFMGEEWILLNMDPPGDAALDNDHNVVAGGRIKIGKESMYSQIARGETITQGDYTIRIYDFEEHGEILCAIVDIEDETGELLERDRIGLGQTKEFSIMGEELVIHLYDILPEDAFDDERASLAVLSRVLELEDGAEVNQDEDDNHDWYVALTWKNHGGNAEDLQADNLRSVIVYADDVEDVSTSGETELEEGDRITFIRNPESMSFVYEGLDITSDERHQVEIEIQELPIGITEDAGPVDGTGAQVACLIYAPYITIQVGDSETFVVHGTTSGTATSNLVMIASSGGYCEGTIGDLNEGDLIMHVSPSSIDNALARYRSGTVIEFATIGDGVSWETGGIIQVSRFEDTVFASQGPFSSETPDFFIGIVEDAGPENSGFVSSVHIGAWTSVSSPTFDRNLTNVHGEVLFSDDGFVVQMAGPVDTGRVVVDEGYITERGSVLGAVTDTTVTMSVADRVVHTNFFIVPYTY